MKRKEEDEGERNGRVRWKVTGGGGGRWMKREEEEEGE